MEKMLKKEELEKGIKKEDPLIVLKKPKKTPKSSKLWDSFHQIFYNEILQEYICCDACKTLLKHRSADGTNGMSSHLSACKKYIKNSISCLSPMTNYFAPVSHTNRRVPAHLKAAITQACTEFAASDMRSFETMAGDGFMNLVRTIFDAGRSIATESNFDVKQLLPHPTTVSRHIDRIYETRKAQLKQFCSSMDRYCVVVDFWTESKTGSHYGGVALRHIDTKIRLHNYILGCYPYDIDKDQKAPNIRAFVEKILDEYGLELNLSTYLVSDNEAKMKSAFGLDYCKRIGCSDHYLSKQLQHSFTSMTIDKENVDCGIAQEMFKKVKDIVTHVRRSHKQMKLPRKLQAYSDTRFNGAFYMLNVFHEVYDDLIAVLDSSHLSVYFEIDKDLLKQTCDFLQPYDEVIEQLSDSKRPNLHRVIPLRRLLLNSCKEDIEDKECIQELKRFLEKRISEVWIPQKEHYLATLLHPNVKRFQIGVDGDREKAIEFLKREITGRQQSQSSLVASISSTGSTSTISPSIEPTRNVTQNLFSKCYDQVCTSQPLFDDEIKRYMESTTFIDEDKGEGVLDFWFKYRDLYPMLTEIARQILSIPASNTEVERLFSAAKFTVSDRRTRLGAEKLNKLIFIQKNLVSLRQLDGEQDIPKVVEKRKSVDDDQHVLLSPKRSKEHFVDDIDDSY